MIVGCYNVSKCVNLLHSNFAALFHIILTMHVVTDNTCLNYNHLYLLNFSVLPVRVWLNKQHNHVTHHEPLLLLNHYQMVGHNTSSLTTCGIHQRRSSYVRNQE